MRIRNPDVMAEYTKRRNRQWIASGIILVVVLPMMFLADRGNLSVFGLPQNVVMGIAVAIVLVGVIFSLTNWRCPECNKYLGKRFNPSYCSSCGVQLHE